MLIPAHTFNRLGSSIANRHHEHGSARIRLARFKAHFGCSPKRCAQIWNLIEITPAARVWLQNGAAPKHLLWGLLWLKLYNTDAVLSGMSGCDEKTFRKWSRSTVMAISKLKGCVVSCARRSSGAGRRHTAPAPETTTANSRHV
jgi:hypothetical protein